jgi:hypothetical protein
MELIEYQVAWEGLLEGEESLERENRLSLDVIVSKRMLLFCSIEAGQCLGCQWDGTRVLRVVDQAVCSSEAGLCAGRGTHLVDEYLRANRENLSRFDVSLSDYPSDTARVSQWQMSATLRSRDEILRSYSNSRPGNLDALVRWLSEQRSESRVVRKLVVPCFKETDPAVYIYRVSEPDIEEIFLTVWNRETSEWMFGGYVTPPVEWGLPVEQESITKLRERILAAPCYTYPIKGTGNVIR